jgi:hypothetical protein
MLEPNQKGYALQPQIGPTLFKDRKVLQPLRSPDALCEPSSKILHGDRRICRAKHCSEIRTSLLQWVRDVYLIRPYFPLDDSIHPKRMETRSDTVDILKEWKLGLTPWTS